MGIDIGSDWSEVSTKARYEGWFLTALVGRDNGPFTKPLREALANDSSIGERLDVVQRQSRIAQPLSTLRALDVVIWMATHGDSQVAP